MEKVDRIEILIIIMGWANRACEVAWMLAWVNYIIWRGDDDIHGSDY